MVQTLVQHSWNDELLKIQAPIQKDTVLRSIFLLKVQCALGKIITSLHN